MHESGIHRIGLYDAYIASLGGGENFLSVFAELLESEFPKAEIEIITHRGNHVELGVLCERFGVELKRTRIRCIEPLSYERMPIRPLRRFIQERAIGALSSDYDLFVNNTIFSVAPPKSRYAIYMCMFPLTPVPWRLREYPLTRWLATPYIELCRWIYHRWVGRYDLLLANSEFTRRWIRKIWGLESKVLYPPIETRSEFSLVKKERKILAIGRFFPGDHNKKHDVLIQEFCHLRQSGLKDWELHLVGGKTPVAGTEAYLHHLRHLAQGEPVTFHLDAPKAQFEELLETSSLFWHATGFGESQQQKPEKLEHFGMSTVEAMNYGCVPLAFRGGGQPEIIRQKQNGFLWVTRSQLREQTMTLVRDDVLRKDLARAAHARSLDFSRSAFKARTREVLDLLPRAGHSI